MDSGANWVMITAEGEVTLTGKKYIRHRAAGWQTGRHLQNAGMWWGALRC
ncbi:MAG: hypothetical protein ACLR7U_06335 [Ruthenibacterium lactatiformans]